MQEITRVCKNATPLLIEKTWSRFARSVKACERYWVGKTYILLAMQVPASSSQGIELAQTQFGRIKKEQRDKTLPL